MWIEVTHTIALRLKDHKLIADRPYVTIEDTGNEHLVRYVVAADVLRKVVLHACYLRKGR